ncbi:hypothetical protein C0J52_04489 [Blattella germanica]|nr:hypothetical protein C0J52_04489 [Blattella germanica]
MFLLVKGLIACVISLSLTVLLSPPRFSIGDLLVAEMCWPNERVYPWTFRIYLEMLLHILVTYDHPSSLSDTLQKQHAFVSLFHFQLFCVLEM